MKISLEWISKFIDISGIEIDDLAHQLTMAGLEVEEVIHLDKVENVVVGKVLKREQHPDADKLSVCLVDDGSEQVNVVCGAPNVTEGMVIPFAKVGAVLPGGFKIKKAKLRGVESFGMICAASELGLEEGKSDGVMDLPSDLEIGADINTVLGLGDTVIDISITPNRADCLSMLGIARDIAAIYNLPLKEYTFEVTESGEEASALASVRVENTEACPAYLGRLIKGIEIKASPLWMQNRLRAVGVRPINNVVDVTNYILFEYGQPLHTFDLTKIEGSIVVRNAENGEKLQTLDGKEQELNDSMLVIADEKKALAVAGVMGGEDSGIVDSSTDVFLECAYFKPESVRMTARRLGLHSDSSYRFERGIDRIQTLSVINYAAALIQEVAGGAVLKGIVANDYVDYQKPSIAASVDEINSLLGLSVSKDDMISFFNRLQFDVESDGDALTVTAPAYRVDIERWVDLSEEVARIYGYDNISTTTPEISADSEKTDGLNKEIRILKNTFASLGFNELVNYSFMAEKYLEIFDDADNFVKLQNPISEDMSTLRTYVFPGVISSIKYNNNQGFKNTRMFEVASTFIKTDDVLPLQKTNLSFAMTGRYWPLTWNSKEEGDAFFQMKGVVEHLLSIYGVECSFERSTRHFMHPGKSAEIFIGEISYGFFGELHPDTLEDVDMDESVYVCEFFLEKFLEECAEVEVKYAAFSKFPSVNKDISVIVDSTVPSDDMMTEIAASSELIEKVDLLDVYTGKGIEDGFVSLMFRIYYSDINKTLTDEETNQSLQTIIQLMEEKFSAKLR